jgi:hypothetical protein
MKRKIAVLTLLLVAVVLLAWTPRAQKAACALPSCNTERVFYTDGTFTTIMGDYLVSCQGVIRSGHSSCYYYHYEYGPCGGGTCSDLEFTCNGGTIENASNPVYNGMSCGCVPVF